MKFNKYPNVKRSFIEVLYMDWIAPLIIIAASIGLVALIVYQILR